MIFVFETEKLDYLLIGAKSEDEALNMIKARGYESVYGKLKFKRMYNGGIIAQDFIKA